MSGLAALPILSAATLFVSGAAAFSLDKRALKKKEEQLAQKSGNPTVSVPVRYLSAAVSDPNTSATRAFTVGMVIFAAFSVATGFSLANLLEDMAESLTTESPRENSTALEISSLSETLNEESAPLLHSYAGRARIFPILYSSFGILLGLPNAYAYSLGEVTGEVIHLVTAGMFIAFLFQYSFLLLEMASTMEPSESINVHSMRAGLVFTAVGLVAFQMIFVMPFAMHQLRKLLKHEELCLNDGLTTEEKQVHQDFLNHKKLRTARLWSAALGLFQIAPAMCFILLLATGAAEFIAFG